MSNTKTRKLTVVRNATEPIRLEPGEAVHVGVDCVLFSAYADDPMFGVQAQGYAASHSYWVSVATPTQLSGGLQSRFIAPTGEVQAIAAPGESVVVLVELAE